MNQVRNSKSLRIGFVGHVIVAGAVLFVAGILWTAMANAAELQPLLDRIDRLERDIRTLNVRVARGGNAPSANSGSGNGSAAASDFDPTGSMARLDVRVTDLEEEVRSLTGKVETVDYHVRSMSERLDKLVADVDFRLSALERAAEGRQSVAALPAPGDGRTAEMPQDAGLPAPVASRGAEIQSPSGAPGTLGSISPRDLSQVNRIQTAPAGQTAASVQGAGAAAASVSPVSATPEQTASVSSEDKYRYAFSLLRQARYPEAEAALREFIEANPEHELVGNARYWLAETYYVRHEYGPAAQLFLEGYTKNPKGNKSADTLLKLGMSLGNLDKKREACAAFSRLGKEFPDAASNIKKVMVREQENYGCN